MFEITGQDILSLSDEDLRSLIGRLCEAELRRHGQSPLGVTWGGDQNAADGGVDVRVSLATPLPTSSAIPRSDVGYQVKAEDIPASRIWAEIRPKGSIRSSIQDLASRSGAYIMVSSKGTVSDAPLKERKRAMREALQDLPNASALHLDFYDRNRIATWVRDHPGIISWVRQKIGRPIYGWRPYDDWAGSGEGIDAAYLTDETVRIHGSELRSEGLPAAQGIDKLRGTLAREQGVARLVGLSGTGKTRLAQALFDARVGIDPLAPDLAIYTDLSNNPVPQPLAVASELVAQCRRHVLVIDNCHPELHRSLSEICRRPESRLSLLTIEYDVKDDLPEDTDVFELRPSSDELIEKLLIRRVDGISQVNANTIARFASGNARVALTLAKTVESGESVASFRDTDLFERLFRQRNEPDKSLLQSARACSLAYSFNAEDRSDGEESELSKLAWVIGKDVRSLHEDIAELQNRDLIQQRGVWKAVLPHAFANRLASAALEAIPRQELAHLIATGPSRLIKSITRRIGYLHTSERAQQLVRDWLADGALLGNVEALDETGKAMLINIAPVEPTSVIDAIERAALRQRELGSYLAGEEFRTLLMSLAFESELFDRSVALILELIEPEKPGPYANQVRNCFSSLFSLYLSGTHATVEQRVRVIDDLLRSSNETRRELGLASLGAMLQTSHFSSSQQFDFGGRPRDYGYFPKTREDVLKWFRAALDMCAVHDARDPEISSKIRDLLSKHLRGLWTEIGLCEEIESICRQFHQKAFWPEGWTAVRSIRHLRHEPLPAEEDAKLAALQLELAPKSLLDRVRGEVLRNTRDLYTDIDVNDYEAQMQRRERSLIEIGGLLARDSRVFGELMPELTRCTSTVTLGPFSKGVVDASNDHPALWKHLIASFEASDRTTRSTEFLCCYLFNLQSVNPDLVESLLEHALRDPQLSEYFPLFQTAVQITPPGVLRLKESLTSGKVPAERFHRLAYAGKSLQDQAILDLIPLLLGSNDGYPVALDIVWMRTQADQRDKKTLSPELIAAGRLVAEAYDFKRNLNHDAYHLSNVITSCLSTTEGESIVRRMTDRLKEQYSKYYGLGSIEENQILTALLNAHPILVLDILLGSESSRRETTQFRLFGHYDLVGSPFNKVPESILLSWCDKVPELRYPLVASAITAFNEKQNSNAAQWTDIALALLERAPDRVEVIKQYIVQLRPMSWIGSLAARWEANIQLLSRFESHEDTKLAAFVRSEREGLNQMLEKLKRDELNEEKKENERFE